jgi:hypothetical protein
MKKLFIILICILVSGVSAFAQFGINADESNPDNSAMLDVKSATKGMLIPRMTFTERDAIASPANGLMVYCTNCGVNGSLSIYSNGAWRTFAPCTNTAPSAGTHIPTNTSIIWNWNTVPDAMGYKWSTTNNYSAAIEMGTATSKTETGLTCGNLYTRYLWAYNSCGVSIMVVLTQSTPGTISTPVAGNHVPDFSSIIWKWSSVIGADGYKWSTTNVYTDAVDMGTAISKTETGLICGTPYSRYVWAYNTCGVSSPVTLTKTTTPAPGAPVSGTHNSTYTTIIWNWNPVASASGYKWSATNVYTDATDMGTVTSKTETDLICATLYTRYVWAYNTCGYSVPVTLTQSTSACFVCGNNITIDHLASNGVAPVDKSVTYGTVTNVPGENPHCWITSNLGADHQATVVSDATEASAGWYWQFNRKQGYKHDGTVRTPSSAWVNNISENYQWLPANDPCTIEIGAGWRLPTNTEWINVDAAAGGNWTNWNGPFTSLLKMHAAGKLNNATGALEYRGASGFYWSGNMFTGLPTNAYQLTFTSSSSVTGVAVKAYGNSIRCIKD